MNNILSRIQFNPVKLFEIKSVENCVIKNTFKCSWSSSVFSAVSFHAICTIYDRKILYQRELYQVLFNPVDLIDLKCSESGKLCEKDTLKCDTITDITRNIMRNKSYFLSMFDILKY